MADDKDGYDKKDAAKDTDSSTSKVSEAWHQAKDDAMKAGELPERQESKIEKAEEKLVDDAAKGSNTSK